jgi:hypothetical protein
MKDTAAGAAAGPLSNHFDSFSPGIMLCVCDEGGLCPSPTLDNNSFR